MAKKSFSFMLYYEQPNVISNLALQEQGRKGAVPESSRCPFQPQWFPGFALQMMMP